MLTRWWRATLCCFDLHKLAGEVASFQMPIHEIRIPGRSRVVGYRTLRTQRCEHCCREIPV